MEHRWGNRVAIDLRVQMFVDPASTAWGKLRDISVSGGFLETELRVAALSTLRMTVPARGTRGARAVRAIVVRSGDDGVGVEWFDGDYETVAQLIRETRTWHTPSFAVERRDYSARL
jgi:PilZ domain